MPRTHRPITKSPSSPRPRARGRFNRAAGLAVVLLLGLATLALAQGLTLGNLVVDNQAGNIAIRFGLGLEAHEDVKTYLVNGATLSLACNASIYEHKSYWFDVEAARSQLVSRLSFDTLAREYVITLPGQESMRGPALKPLLDKAWGRLTLDLGPWRTLERGVTYSLVLRVGLDRLDVPAWLRRTLFFWSWDVVPETSYQLDFTY